MSGARAMTADATEKANTPLAKSRLRPNASANAPAVIKRLPKLSMKALVIQFNASALPPRSRPIATVAMAPPVKLRGRISAAKHTAASTQARPRLDAAREGGGNGASGVVSTGIFPV